MRVPRKLVQICLRCAVVLVLPIIAQAQYVYTTNANNTLTITDYTGESGVAVIPDNFNGLPVTGISDGAFDSGMFSILVPASITNIVDYAFAFNPELTNVTFEGAAPNTDSTVFDGDTEATVYYMGTVFMGGWKSMFDGCSTALSEFSFTSQNGAITITGYNGPSDALAIPSSLFGLPVTCIASYAFDEDDTSISPTSITMPDSVTTLQGEAFQQAYVMTNITIGSGVTNIEGPLFLACFYLNTITVDPLNPFFTSFDGVLFNKSQSVLIQYPPAKIGASYVIPNSVTSIAAEAFEYAGNIFSHGNLSSVTIPGSATNIGEQAFYGSGLNSVYFRGDPPTVDSTAFGDNNPTVYYLSDTTGWSSPFAGQPAVLWNPLIQAGGSSFGVESNQFGFNITGTNNYTVVVEACTNLANPVWTALQTLTLSNGSAYFSDAQWTNYAARFYGLGWP